MYGTPRDYTPQDDIWVAGLILACFLILLLVIGHHRRYIGNMSRKFFLPTNREEKPGQKTTGERALPWLSSLALTGAGGLTLFAYVCWVYDLEKSPYYIWSVLLLCVGAFAGYYLVRWLLYSFAGWIFFERQQRQQWTEGFSLLMIYESVVVYVLMCTSMFYHLSLEETGLAVAICYGLLRLAVIPHTKRIFFSNFYGILHLIAYLCTLEFLPLLALWKFGEYWGAHLVAR